MSAANFRNIAVIGAGTMGAPIVPAPITAILRKFAALILSSLKIGSCCQVFVIMLVLPSLAKPA